MPKNHQAMRAPKQLAIDLLIADKKWLAIKAWQEPSFNAARSAKQLNKAMLASFCRARIDLCCSLLDIKESYSELSLFFTNDKQMREINNKWREQDKTTNVLSFPNPMGNAPAMAHSLGDIVFAFEQIEKEACEADKSFSAHFTHLLIHGFLHLLGYDHKEKEEEQKMQNLEIAILAKLNIANPYVSLAKAELQI